MKICLVYRGFIYLASALYPSQEINKFESLLGLKKKGLSNSPQIRTASRSSHQYHSRILKSCAFKRVRVCKGRGLPWLPKAIKNIRIFSINAKYFTALTIIVLATGLDQPSACTQGGAERNKPPLVSIFGNVFVQHSRLNPSQQTNLVPPDTGTPDGRRTPGGSRVTKSN
jgi:hypothetical protein